ncbi:hypothetical protein MDAP_001383 [Mitosporidium daphniae]
MRVTRTKRCKRLISFYMKTFGFRYPFQAIVDPEFIQASIVSKVRLEHGVPELLTGPAKLMITGCTIHELRSLGDRYYGALFMSKSFERIRNCKHAPGSVSSLDCIREQIGSANKHKYVVCSQDTAFLQELSTLGGVPTIHIYKGVLQLDPISSASKALKEEKEAQKDKLTKAERREIATLINQPDPTDVPQKRVKRKIVKGPNPLSVKKRKALVGRNSEALPTAEQQRPIRKRKRKPSTKEDV